MKRAILLITVLLQACGSGSNVVDTQLDTSTGAPQPVRQPLGEQPKADVVHAYCVSGAVGSSVLRFIAQPGAEGSPKSTLLQSGVDPYPLTRVSHLSVRGDLLLFSAEPIDPASAPTGPGSAVRKVYVAKNNSVQKANATALFPENELTEAAQLAFQAKNIEVASFSQDKEILALRGAERDSYLVRIRDGQNTPVQLDRDAQTLANPVAAGENVLFDAFEPSAGSLRKYLWLSRERRGAFLPAGNGIQFGGGAIGALYFWFESGDKFQFAYGSLSSAKRLTLPVRGSVLPASLGFRRTSDGLVLAFVTRENNSLFTAWNMKLLQKGQSFEVAENISVPVNREDWKRARSVPGDAAAFLFRFSADLGQLLVLDRSEGGQARVVGLEIASRSLSARSRATCSEFAKEIL